MESNHSTRNKNIGTLIHASTFSKYFFPFGNFIFPLILWLSNRKKSSIDAHGKECLNFQMSIFLYSAGLALIGFFGMLIFLFTGNSESIRRSFDPLNFKYFNDVMPFFFFIGSIGFLLLALCIIEIVCVVQASVRASEGKLYHYPISIPFLPKNGSKNETFTTKKETL